MKCARGFLSSAGFSLVEMIVAMSLGLLLLASLVTIYLSSKNTYRLQQALARMQEEGRFVSAYLMRQIAKAHYLTGFRVQDNDGILLDRQLKLFIAKTSYLNIHGKPVYALYSKVQTDKRKKLLADNVIAMRARYGQQCATRHAICQYVAAKQVNDWSQIKAIQLALLIVSTQTVFYKPQPYRFAGEQLAPSRHLRQEWDIYATTKRKKR